MKDVQDTVLPTDPKERKGIPIASGVLDYFPAAIAYIAKVSKVGNDQHNPGEPLHWARGKSMDHPDTIMRHFMERGTIDKDNLRHTGKAAWRMLALLQEELEREEGAPLPRGAKVIEGQITKALEEHIFAMQPEQNARILCDTCGVDNSWGEDAPASLAELDHACGNIDCLGHMALVH